LKKIPETDAIFENVLKENEASDQDIKSLRISIDTKAKVKIGNLSYQFNMKLHRIGLQE